MTTDLLTPLAGGRVVELGNRLWRKQVLPKASINYRGGKLDFTDDYLRNVADAFRGRAFDTVPFMLADRDNRHTMDPRHAGGEVLDLQAEDDGLYATVRLSEAAEEIVRDNPKFGVSVRIKEGYDRSDGRHYAAACQHVLGTFDGVVPGMKPWQAVDLSHTPGDAVIDLSSLAYAPAPGTTDPLQEGNPMTAPTVTGDQVVDALRSLLAPALTVHNPTPTTVPPADPAATPVAPTTDEQADELTDEEFDKWAAEVMAEATAEQDDDDVDTDDPDDYGHVPDEQDRETSQPADQGGDVLLSEVAYQGDRVDALELSNRDLRAQLDASNYEKERDELARLHGIPPHIIDLARPLLEGSNRTVELSNGSEADAGDVMRKVIAEFGKVAKLLDLSDPVAAGLLAPDDGKAERAEQVRTRGAEIAGSMGLLGG